MYLGDNFPLQYKLQFERPKETEEYTSTAATQIDLPYGEKVSNIVQQLEPQH